MRTTSRWKAGVAALVAVGSVFGASAMSDVAAALPAGTPPAQPGGGLALFPASGSAATPFQIQFDPINQACPGDNTTGWLYTPFITQEPDVAPLTFSVSGSPLTITGERTTFFRDNGGNIIRNIFPSLNNFLVNSVSNVSIQESFFNGQPPLVPGDYTVGVACQNPTGTFNGIPARENAIYWTTTMRVTDNAGTWTTNIPPDAPGTPTNVAAAPLDGAAEVTFDEATGTGIGAATSFEVTAVPDGGGAPITVTGPASPLTLPGLTNGTAYAVTVVATNGGGSSAPSSPAVNVTPVAGAQPAINFTTAPGTGSSTVSFTAPVAGVGGFTAVPTSYTLTVSPAPASPGLASYTIPAAVGSISQLVEGLTPGVAYTATLSPTYAGADNGPSVSRPIVGNSAQIIQQRITVTRPVGQLILTQRCGVNGDIPAFTGSDLVPGFPTDLDAIVATANQTGTSPDITPAAPGLPADAVTVDPEFDNYPFPSPATYPTECGIDLGTSTIVTTGAGAGLYFQADGNIDEVTVTDTRDTGAGWTLNGTMSDFTGTNTPSNSFDGGWMGWVPELQSNTVNQTITTGLPVLPGTGILDVNAGLDAGALLGSAAPGAALGITEFDARLLLLIPTSTPTDDYVGILSFSVV